jgi:nitrate reductase NapE component
LQKVVTSSTISRSTEPHSLVLCGSTSSSTCSGWWFLFTVSQPSGETATEEFVAVWSQNISKKTALWSYVTLAICLWDFIIVVILGADYGKCLDFVRSDQLNPIMLEMICANAILPVLVVAAKGFVLWFVNVALALLLMNAANQA